MTTARSIRLLAAGAAALLTVAACGGDDDGDAAGTTTEAPAETTAAPVTTDAAAPTTEAAPETTEAASTTEAVPDTTEAAPGTTAAGGYVEGADPAADAAATAVVTVYDSTADIEAKIPLLENGEALRPVLESYVTAAEAVGDITVEPTAVTLDGETGTVAYDLFFAGTNPYPDAGLSADVISVDGAWQVSQEAFCGFMAQARNNCP